MVTSPQAAKVAAETVVAENQTVLAQLQTTIAKAKGDVAEAMAQTEAARKDRDACVALLDVEHRSLLQVRDTPSIYTNVSINPSFLLTPYQYIPSSHTYQRSSPLPSPNCCAAGERGCGASEGGAGRGGRACPKSDGGRPQRGAQNASNEDTGSRSGNALALTDADIQESNLSWRDPNLPGLILTSD